MTPGIKLLIRELFYLILAVLSFIPSVLGRIVAIGLIGLLVFRFLRNLPLAKQEWREAGSKPETKTD